MFLMGQILNHVTVFELILFVVHWTVFDEKGCNLHKRKTRFLTSGMKTENSRCEHLLFRLFTPCGWNRWSHACVVVVEAPPPPNPSRLSPDTSRSKRPSDSSRVFCLGRLGSLRMPNRDWNVAFWRFATFNVNMCSSSTPFMPKQTTWKWNIFPRNRKYLWKIPSLFQMFHVPQSVV